MKIIKDIVGWIIHIVFCIIVALSIVVFIIQLTSVDGYSMEPTLHDRDKVLVSKVHMTLGIRPDYGDIVVVDRRIYQSRKFLDLFKDYLKYNTVAYWITGKKPDPVFIVKRVIGKPGDVLEYVDGQLVINGVPVEEPYIKEPMEWFPDKAIIVPENHVFVMGDNRNESYDSRIIGCIPLSHVLGKCLFTIF